MERVAAPQAAEPRTDLSPALWLLAAACLGQALRVYDGTRPDPVALRWVAATIVLAAAGTWWRPGATAQWLRMAVPALGPALVVLQITQLLTLPLGKRWVLPRENMRFLHLTLTATAAALGASWGRARAVRWLAWMVLGAALASGLWYLRKCLQPEIDVFEFQQQACATLSGGNNPYAMTFANIYPDDSPFYAKGLAVDGRLQFGFIYPPLLLALDCPVWLLTGDHRYALWLALVGACALVYSARPGPASLAAATLLWTTPRTFFLVEQAWTEPFVLLGLAGVLWAALRAPRALPWCFGLLLSTKQYMVLAAPLGLLLLPQPWTAQAIWRFVRPAAVVVAVLNLPFFVVDPGAFWRSVVTLQMVQPFRPDSLSWLAALAHAGQPTLPLWLAFALAGIAIAVGLWRAPRTPAGFAAATALVFLAFLAFNKQAFWNYYHLPLGALAMAAAVAVPPREPAAVD